MITQKKDVGSANTHYLSKRANFRKVDIIPIRNVNQRKLNIDLFNDDLAAGWRTFVPFLEIPIITVLIRFLYDAVSTEFA